MFIYGNYAVCQYGPANVYHYWGPYVCPPGTHIRLYDSGSFGFNGFKCDKNEGSIP